MNRMSNFNIIIISSSKWDDFWTRKQRLALFFSKNNKVIYVNPPAPLGLRQAFSFKKVLQLFFFNTKQIEVNKNLTVIDSPALIPGALKYSLINYFFQISLARYLKRIVDEFNFSSPIIINYLPFIPKVLLYLNKKVLVYDCVDDFSKVGGFLIDSSLIECLEKKVLEVADICIVTNIDLQEKHKSYNKDIYLVPNGVDFNLFNSIIGKKNKEPEDIKNIPHPRIGFKGTIQYWLDYDLIKEIAVAYPNYSFIFIGKIYAQQEVEKLRSLKNIFFLGEKEHKILPVYAQFIDVFILPFQIEGIGKSASPLKLYEYLATGKPIVSTSISETLSLKDVIYTANNHEEFKELIHLAIKDKNSCKKSKRIKIAQQSDWSNRFRIIEKIIERNIFQQKNNRVIICLPGYFPTQRGNVFSFRNSKQLIKDTQRLKELIAGFYSLKDKNLKIFIELLFSLLKADEKYFIDNEGNKEIFSFWRFIFIDAPLFIIEVFFSLGLLGITWLIMFLFFVLSGPRNNNNNLNAIVYLRTDNFRGLQQGGSFTHFRGIVKGFYQLGFSVNYIGSGDIEVSQLEFPKTIIPYPLKFNLPEIPEIYYNWRFIPRALRIIQKEKPLFIYQRHSIFNVCGAILSQITGIPLVLEYNGSEYWSRQKWGGLLIFKRLCYFMENFSLKKAALITVVSRPLKDELLKRGIPEKKILVNYNGVDIEEFNPKIDGSEIRKKYNLEDKIVIGAVSTFGVWHGMPILARAVKLIINRIQNTEYRIHFLFIGDGVERPKCESIIKEDKMEDYVTFTGIVPYKEIPKYLAACDIFVSPHIPNPDGSEFFGSPTKIFEYMAMGKPIVASKLGQIGEILKDKETALLVEPGNVEELVKEISELIKDEKLRDTLGNKARLKAVAEFSWSNNVEKLIQTFKQL